MQIRFVNHASYVCESAGVRLMCDPWLYGSAFNDGWDLVAETRFQPAEFADIDFVWYSHEHPDHFSPRVLADVPQELRSRITVLYKASTDGKVLGFCKKLGFGTRELPDGERVVLAPDFAVTCRRVPLHDSWLVIESDGRRVVNLNDAVVDAPNELRRLRERLGPVDVLFTQFNYAAWRGNREDTAVRRADAAKKLDIMVRQIRGLKPRYTVPFASFSRFSHEENSFTNDAANLPAAAVRAVETTESTPVLLYPDDRWTVGAPHDNAGALARYALDYEAAASRPLRTSAVVPFETLVAEAERYVARIRKVNDARMLALASKNPVLPLLGDVEIHLWDLGADVRFSFRGGLRKIDRRTAKYDLRMSSDSLHFLLKNAWGIDTLTVNGRFQADAAGLKQLVTTFGVDALNNSGIRLTPAFLLDRATIAFLSKLLIRKLWSLRRAERTTRAAIGPSAA